MDQSRNEIPPHKLITALRNYNLLPAIVFLPTRRKCDEAATEVSGDRSQPADAAKQQKREEIFNAFAVENPEIKKHKHRKILLTAGVASHHAGHIPSWKLVVEKLMSAGLLNAIFATSTVAAGVDFPARTVVISNADARGNDGWRALHASELQQMTGRAGRRGKDNVGFAILIPGQFQKPKKIAELLKSQPEPLESKFRATYTSLLNLLDAFGNFEQVREIAEKSFAFQETKVRIDKLERSIETISGDIGEILKDNDFGFKLKDALGFERLTSARQRLHDRLPVTRAEMRGNWLRENVVAGRVVTQGRSAKRLYLVLDVHGDAVSAMREDGSGTTFALSRVTRVYGDVTRPSVKNIEKIFFDVYEQKNLPLDEPKLSNTNLNTDAADDVFAEAVSRFFAGIDDRQNAERLLWETTSHASRLVSIENDIYRYRQYIWRPFEQRASVLAHFDYLDLSEQKVTDAGRWLADLRIDRPLLVGEVLKKGIFDTMPPKILGAVMASIAADADRNYGELYLSDDLLALLSVVEDTISEIAAVEFGKGIDPETELNYSAAAAVENWVDGITWDQLVGRTKAEEGDLVRVLSRTGEALMQLANLAKSNPKAAETARVTAEIILREPVR